MDENKEVMINEENIEVTPENTEITTAVDAETGEEVYVTGLTTGEKAVGLAGAGLALYGAVDLSVKGFRFIKNRVKIAKQQHSWKAAFKFREFKKPETTQADKPVEVVETTEE